MIIQRLPTEVNYSRVDMYNPHIIDKNIDIYKKPATHILCEPYLPNIPKGLYIWGNVGTGKSMLMNEFYSNIPIKDKAKYHFHEFMKYVRA